MKLLRTLLQRVGLVEQCGEFLIAHIDTGSGCAVQQRLGGREYGIGGHARGDLIACKMQQQTVGGVTTPCRRSGHFLT